MPTRTLTAVALAAIVALAACGGGTKHDPAADVKAAYAAYGRALDAGDGAKVCALLSPAAERQFMATARQYTGTAFHDCATAFATLRKLIPRTPHTLTDVKVDGDRATGVDAGLSGGAKKTPVRLRRVAGAWRIDAARSG